MVLTHIGVWRIGGNWPIRLLALIINSIMALGPIETFYIIRYIIILLKIKWLRDGKRWRIRSHCLYC